MLVTYHNLRRAICALDLSNVGPLAQQLVVEQSPLDVYAPLRELAAREGKIALMGVGLDRMTFLHVAEQEAGRELFRRWADGADGQPMCVAVGGCSQGFEHFARILVHLRNVGVVGKSQWQIFPAGETLKVAAHAIRAQPLITHCGNEDCSRCNDAVSGGPLLN
jgi:aminoglycoside N3'-acetyltransferase